MAHLNLRDRVIETTIAYVGSEKSASSTFAHVQRAVQRGRAGTLKETPMGAGRVLSLDWKPREEMRLNDCELTVKLVSVESVEGDAMQDVLVDADGLVLVVDAEAAALDRNRQAVTTVRDALARAVDKKVPVVVQVNEGESGAGQQGLEALGAEEWPRVRAKAATGEGLMETLQRAVGVVVQSMQSASGPEATPARAAGTLRAEGNPLLAALRQLLQATVSDQLSAFERRLDDRFMAQDQQRPPSSPPLSDWLASLEAAMDRREPVAADTQSQMLTSEALSRIERALLSSRERLDAVHAQNAAIAECLEGLATTMKEFAAAPDRPSSTDHDERATKLNALAALVDDLRKKRKSWL